MIRKEDYAFTVEVAGEKWDVYHFYKDDKPGTLGFMQRDGKWIIGMLCAGHLNEVQATEHLDKNRLREAN